jgi:hypothetical protein
MSLEELAGLLREMNRISGEVARIIGRPALGSHIGEYVTSRVFGIGLESSATARGIDGRFVEGPLKGSTVNIKFYGKKENILDVSLVDVADYYLVLTGPDRPPSSSKGEARPLVVSQVFLFNIGRLVPELTRRGIKIGIATSVRKQDWDEAMVYPVQRNKELILSSEQVREIALFSGDDHECIG